MPSLRVCDCSCCASIVGRVPGPGEFLWHDPRGYTWPLCGECVGWWLLYALADGDLMPARISRNGGGR